MPTLLLADDSVTIQRVIELTFANENVRVVSVGDGRRALQWMDREVPDVILADVGAPEVDGYELTSQIRQSSRLRHVPVLLLAGVFERVDEDLVRGVGADGVLVKPFEPEQLVSRVRSLMDQGASRGADGTSSDAPSRPRRLHDGDGARVVMPFPAAARASAAPASASPQAAALHETTDAATRREAALPSRVSLANAFSALLAAEQSVQPAAAPAPAAPPAPPPAPVLSDAVVEEAVRRALVRMTDNVVRRIVVETAERLIREEIEKIKANPE